MYELPIKTVWKLQNWQKNHWQDACYATAKKQEWTALLKVESGICQNTAHLILNNQFGSKRSYYYTAAPCAFLLTSLLSFISIGSLKFAVSTHVKADRPASTIMAVL